MRAILVVVTRHRSGVEITADAATVSRLDSLGIARTDITAQQLAGVSIIIIQQTRDFYISHTYEGRVNHAHSAYIVLL